MRKDWGAMTSDDWQGMTCFAAKSEPGSLVCPGGVGEGSNEDD